MMFMRLVVACLILLAPVSAFAEGDYGITKDDVSSARAGYPFSQRCSSSGDIQTSPGIGDSVSISGKVPEPYRTIFSQAAAKYDTMPNLVAAIFYAGEHGSTWPNPEGPWASSSAGAKGPFQFVDGTWAMYGVDADHKNGAEVQNLKDAAFGAAHYLSVEAKNGASEEDIKDAIFLYNHADFYVNMVYAAYQKFSGDDTTPSDSAAGSSPAANGDCEEAQSSSDGVGTCSTLRGPAIKDADGLARALDKYIKNSAPNSPMKGMGKDFVEAGQNSDINPLFMMAIAKKEANYLSDPNATDMINGNNPFAYSQYGSWPASGRWAKFPDIPTGIREITKQIKKDYVQGGVNGGKPLVTVAEVFPKYAPSVENDTDTYVKQVQGWIKEMQRLAGASLSCGAGAASIIKYNPPLPGDGTIRPTAIILHWWDGRSNGNGIETLYDVLKQRGLSVQLGILADGKTYQLTPSLSTKASHAFCANSYAIGIEIEGVPEDFGNNPKHPEQFKSVVATVKYLMDKYDIPLDGAIQNPSSDGAIGVHSHKQINDLCDSPGAKADKKEDVDNVYLKRVKDALRGDES